MCIVITCLHFFLNSFCSPFNFIQVPKSYPLKNGRCEPSYSSPLQTNLSDRRIPPTGHIYCNIPSSQYAGKNVKDKPNYNFIPATIKDEQY